MLQTGPCQNRRYRKISGASPPAGPAIQTSGSTAAALLSRNSLMVTEVWSRMQLSGSVSAARPSNPVVLSYFFDAGFTAKSHTCMFIFPEVYSITAYSPGGSGSFGQIL